MAKKARRQQKEKLFEDKLVPAKKGSRVLFEVSYGDSQPIECLGMTFENDEARRAYFLDKLNEKLKDSEFRKIDGFPIGHDEDILALSDPPYYTACPNPFLVDFIRHHSDDDSTYHKEPFSADISEGKNDPIYNAHSYHTKVPHKAIMRYVLHYTQPGHVIFDGFCGTGMTGVAAQACSDRSTIESLGYTVTQDGTVHDDNGDAISTVGPRATILNDLCPAATFLAYNYNTHVSVEDLEGECEKAKTLSEHECGWLYNTLHNPRRTQLAKAVTALSTFGHAFVSHCPDATWGQINYTVWSDVFVCPECSNDVVFWEAAVDKSTGNVQDSFECSNCNAIISKRNLSRSWYTQFDDLLQETVKRPKQVPVLINYSYAGKRFEKTPDEFDTSLVEFIDRQSLPFEVPVVPMLFKGTEWGDTWRAGVHSGITHSHHFYTRRNLWALSALFHKTTSPQARCALLGGYTVGLRTARFLPLRWVNKDTGPMKPHTAGTLYVPSLNGEQNWFNIFESRVRSTVRAYRNLVASRGTVAISTGSLTNTEVPDSSIDYIFTDPPFGGNLMYSELNFLWESWLKVYANNTTEAIVSSTQGKGLREYEKLMATCFSEYFRVLKPGRWMTVEFHNSKNSVWNAIQQGLQEAGFVVADVRTLDKKQGTFKQVTTAGAVKQDLIISAYKPNGGLEARFELVAGTEKGVWEFVQTHLHQIPTFVRKGAYAEVIAERQDYLLFDRMVAFHVQRGVTVPLSAAEFYAGLRQRYPERDGMFFLPEQAVSYDKQRATVSNVEQLELFVSDELSAIKWVKQQLQNKPQGFSELQPQFMREVAGWEKHERPLELSEMLEQNFLCYDGKGDVPSQIHSYLSTNFHEFRNLDKDDPNLIAKAKNRWYVPDPRKEADLEKIRHRALMKEFNEYRDSKGKLKVVRTEALRAGFKECWQNGDYQSIVDMAKRVKDDIIQEDPALLMYYDNASMRVGD